MLANSRSTFGSRPGRVGYTWRGCSNSPRTVRRRSRAISKPARCQLGGITSAAKLAHCDRSSVYQSGKLGRHLPRLNPPRFARCGEIVRALAGNGDDHSGIHGPRPTRRPIPLSSPRCSPRRTPAGLDFEPDRELFTIKKKPPGGPYIEGLVHGTKFRIHFSVELCTIMQADKRKQIARYPPRSGTAQLRVECSERLDPIV